MSFYTEERRASARRQLVETARAVLAGGLDPIDGCRQVCDVLRYLELAETEIQFFDPFVGVASEADIFPHEKARTLWSRTYLAELDRKRADYSRRIEASVRQDFLALLERYEAQVRRDAEKEAES